ncbi:hypothetical protein [Virgisporangium ochraceum]|uniref:Uncharacterized protein n=1 Tax=Virgisporangium ochraceum TaxID=65505 RepID=A0A8J3ZY70_9ACTN|nr:hypothetical protein [Virgisporangium ochraceum]GIJ72299.1 hypothetical protein Voc01_072160 [Virgisporangium ochraceum]
MTPYDTDEIPDIPADLADAVRHAAAAVPAGRHSIGEVHRRRRLHQRRRTAAVAGVATVAVAAGAAGVPALFRASGPGPVAATPTAPASAPAAAGPAQRLLLGNPYLSIEGPGGGAGITGPSGILEVDPGGSIVAHPVTGVDSADQVVALPDGRLVVLGPRNLKPGVARNDGVDVTDLEFRLVFGGYNANVRVRGEQLRLVGATAEGAYLLRNMQRLVFHEFATGAERPLTAATATMMASGLPVNRWDEQVQNGRLVFRTVGDTPTVRVVDVSTGAEVVHPLRFDGVPADGYHVEELRLSPDGRTLALVISEFGAGSARYRLVTVDVATGRTAGPSDVATIDPASKSTGVLGLAFTDNRTVRVATVAFPAGATRMYQLSELLKVSTFTV